MEGPLIAVQNCSFSYGEGEFRLRDVSLHASEGEVLGIVGPNGSGKSTLLRLMAGFLTPSGGAVSLDGQPLRALKRRRLATRLAFLPQSTGAGFRFSAREVVAMGRYPYQGAFGLLGTEDVRVVERAMAETGTADLADRMFTTLSGGEKQRVLIGATLAQEPAVMLLDEPTAALDIHHQCDVLDLLWQLSRKGIAVVMVTHDLNAAGQFCDRLALLSEGLLLRTGSPPEVLQQQVLSETYGAEVRVVQHPVTAQPMVLVLGETAHAAE